MLWAALLVGVCVHLGGFLLFQVRSNPLPDRMSSEPLLSFLSAGAFAGDAEWREQALLFDSAPLFIPTRWNAASQDYVARDSGVWLFPEYEPAIDLEADLRAGASLLMDDYAVSAPQDLLGSQYWQSFDAFGEEVQPVVSFVDARGFAEVHLVGTGGFEPLLLQADVEYEGLIAREPAVFTLRVNGSGELLSQPRLLASSGNDSFDRSAQGWLGAPRVVGQLPAGYLVVRVFP